MLAMVLHFQVEGKQKVLIRFDASAANWTSPYSELDNGD